MFNKIVFLLWEVFKLVFSWGIFILFLIILPVIAEAIHNYYVQYPSEALAWSTMFILLIGVLTPWYFIIKSLWHIVKIIGELLPSKHPGDNANNHSEESPDNAQPQGKEQKPL
jgi:hypothetical protein